MVDTQKMREVAQRLGIRQAEYVEHHLAIPQDGEALDAAELLVAAAVYIEGLALRPIDKSTPKDRPILAWCDHEADPFVLEELEGGRRVLTLYAAHAEGMSHAPTGWHIIEWGGAFDDSTWEYPNGAHLPDWWFVAGSEFEVAANPTYWCDLPAAPVKESKR